MFITGNPNKHTQDYEHTCSVTLMCPKTWKSGFHNPAIHASDLGLEMPCKTFPI